MIRNKVFIGLIAFNIATVAGLVAAQYLRPVGHGSASFVTVDAVKITNAERAVASSLFNQGLNGGNQDAIVSLNDFGKKVTAEIEKIADGRTVIVKQAVVSGNVPDITDDVLKGLNLPMNAPSIDISKQLEMAPTSAYQLMGAQMEKIAKSNGEAAKKSFVENQKKAAINELP